MKLSRDEKKLVIAALTNDLERVKSTVLTWELTNLRKKFERACYSEPDDVKTPESYEPVESTTGNGMSPT